MIASVVVPAPMSLIPSSQITWVSPDRPSTSRSSRSTAAGPAAELATTGFTTLLPAMASLTMLILLPYALCNRRESAFIHRSFTLSVECVPSVIESPKAQTTTVSDGAMTSTASRKNQEVVVNSNAKTSGSAVWSPLPGAVIYEVTKALL